MQLGICYYPEQWPQKNWDSDAKQMVDMGIEWVRIAEFTWSLIEPEPNEYNWQWLDDAITVLANAGLKIILGTPTAAPPKWLIDRYPDILPVTAQGITRKFGARRHYTFSSERYHIEVKRIVTQMAQRYALNSKIYGWQIDNEYGDHDTIFSYGSEDLKAFRQWLIQKYQTIDQLNYAWGTTFWGMHYRHFDEIELPNHLVEEPSPTHLLDYRRFASDQVIRFNKMQVDAIKSFNPNTLCIHNVMSQNNDFDHFQLGQDLDIVAWDVYPLGGVVNSWISEEQKEKYYRTGIPDRNGLNHELYRHAGQGRMWVMEIQPGPVNWASSNFAPHDGMFRLWAWEAFAHGAELFVPFRFRQALYGQEQYHSGLLLPNGEEDQGALELRQFAKELALLKIQNTVKPNPRQVAIVWDYQSKYAIESLPQGASYQANRLSFELFQQLRQQGVDVDIISTQASLDSYKLVIILDMVIVKEDFVVRLKKFKGNILIGPRCGSKTENFWHPYESLPPSKTLAPGSLQSLIDLQVIRVESFPEHHQESIQLAESKKIVHGYMWRETVRTTAKTIAYFSGDYRSGAPALVEQNNIRYLTCWPMPDFAKELIQGTLKWAGVTTIVLADDFRIASIGDYIVALNYSNKVVTAPLFENYHLVIGKPEILARDVAVWQRTEC